VKPDNQKRGKGGGGGSRFCTEKGKKEKSYLDTSLRGPDSEAWGEKKENDRLLNPLATKRGKGEKGLSRNHHYVHGDLHSGGRGGEESGCSLYTLEEGVFRIGRSGSREDSAEKREKIKMGEWLSFSCVKRGESLMVGPVGAMPEKGPTNSPASCQKEKSTAVALEGRLVSPCKEKGGGKKKKRAITWLLMLFSEGEGEVQAMI